MDVEHELMELYQDKVHINSNDEYLSQEEEPEQVQRSSISHMVNKQNKAKIPKIFHKAKRTITKLVNQFFTQLKNQVMKGYGQVKMYQEQLDNIVRSLHQFIRIGSCGGLKSINFQGIQNKHTESNIFSFVSQSKKIVECTKEGKINQIQLFVNSPRQVKQWKGDNSQQKKELKLPDGGTPIPFGQNFYILDGSQFHPQRKIYVPCLQFFKIKKNGEVSTVNPLKIFPPVDYNYQWSFNEFPLHRIKCSLVKDEKFIYMLGGYIQQFKVLTKHCQKFDPISNVMYTLPKLNFAHKCPTATIVQKKIWLFSENAIQFLDLDLLEQYEKRNLKHSFPSWKAVQKPLGALFSPFQFIYNLPHNSEQLLIFGGMKNNRKLKSVMMYNLKTQQFEHCGDLLPQGVCNSRSWGPAIIKQHLAFFSQIQAAIYPQVGVKSQCSQLIFMGSNGSCYLQSFVNT